MSARLPLQLTVNGQPRSLQVEPDASLLEVLREELGLTGAKKGCEEGECGACTVLLDGTAVASCLTPALKCSGRQVLTVEGLAAGGRLSPLQEAFIAHGAVQCGYCTPGMLMSASALLENNPRPDREEIAAALSGNLCRCTGYVKIIDAVQAASGRPQPERKTGDGT